MKKHIFLTIMIIAFFMYGCSDIFENKIGINIDKPQTGSLSDILIEKPVITKLSTPTQFFVSQGYSPSTIKLTWKYVEGAASYRIEKATIEPDIDSNGLISYKEPEDGDYELLEGFIYETNYNDNIIKIPQTNSQEYNNRYYYRIFAENIGKKYLSSDSSESLYGTLLRSPLNVKASLGLSNTEIKIQWEKVDNATSYSIYRSNYSSGVASYYIGSIQGNQTWYTNIVSEEEQGIEYYYTVYAINSSDINSVSSNIAMGYALLKGAPQKPTNVRLSSNSGRGNSINEIKIEWDASIENDIYYAVYRYSSEDSTLVRITDKTTNTYWTDKRQLKPGVFYYYQVQAIKQNSEGKLLKSQFSTDLVEGYILSAPTTIKAVRTKEGKIFIMWYPALGSKSEQETYSYDIYADNDISGSFLTKIFSISSPALIDQDGYIHADNIPSYEFYKIITKTSLLESAPSNVIAISPSAAIVQEVTKYAKLDGKSPNSSNVYPVKIVWKNPENETPTAYNIYRSTNSEKGFQKINDNPINASQAVGGLFTYYDSNELAKPGIKYYYRVLSLNTLLQGANYSETYIGYGALTHDQYMLEYNKTVKSSLKKLTRMHEPLDTNKLGDDSAIGTITGILTYKAGLVGTNAATIIMYYNDYADFYINNDKSQGIYFSLKGNSNTTSDRFKVGNMYGTVVCTGMYPGKVYYDKVEIKGGAAGGGSYGIEPEGFGREEVSWTLGEQ